MNLSSTSSAFNEAAHDGTIPNVDAAIASPPRIRQSQRHKRQLSQLNDDDDEADGDPYARVFQSYQQSTAAHRRVHSPQRVRRRINAILDSEDEEEHSQLLFT